MRLLASFWTESNMKKRGIDFITGCGYTLECFAEVKIKI